MKMYENHENLWNSIKIVKFYNIQWKSIKINWNLKSMQIFENIWKSMRICENT